MMLQFVLNFHGVGPIIRDLDDPEEYDCWLDADHFEEILDVILGLPNVSLTFDDGNSSDLHFALPALLRRRISASFFICTGRLGESTFLTREDVKHLQAQGMQIGSHGMTHRSWKGLSSSELQAELNASRLELEDICGGPVVEAACPFGAYGRTVLQALRHAGFQRVYTSDGGWATSSSWLMPRNTVRRSHSVEHIQKLVASRPGPLTQVIGYSRRLVKRYL